MTDKRNRRFKRNIRSFLVISALALTGIAPVTLVYAATPEVTVRETTNEVLATIAGTHDAQRLQQLAESKIVPHFDFRRLTQLAAGRVWSSATPQQQDQMAAEFQRLLVRIYTKSLATATGDAKVAVQPARPADASGETMVRTTVNQSGRQPIAIDYRLVRQGDSWKVVDVIVENISLVSNYRDWFATQAANGGVDSVIQALQAKNRNAA